MDEVLEKVTEEICRGSSAALRSTKQLLIRLGMMGQPDKLADYTARMLAHAMTSDEGREGIAAFLEKRSPSWLKEKE